MKKILVTIGLILAVFLNVDAQTYALNTQPLWNSGDRTAAGKVNLNATGLSCHPDGMKLFLTADSTFLGTDVPRVMRSITFKASGCNSCGGSIRDEGQYADDTTQKRKFYSIEYFPRKYATQPVSNSNCLVKQIKTSTDAFPTWAIWMEPVSGVLRWRLHKTVDSLNTNNAGAIQTTYDMGTVTYNDWTKFTIEANWSHTNTGYLKVYKGNTLVFSWVGATMNKPYNLSRIGYDLDRNGIYDFGLCPIDGADNTTQREVYMKNWKVGDANNTLSDFITVAATGPKAYYVSATGNDANNGTSPATPWQTITKVNNSWASIAAGDSILFKRGDVFSGTITVGTSGTSGNRLLIGAYGTGAKPLISGYQTLTGWSGTAPGAFSVSFPSGAKNFINLEFDGVMQRMGRTPNYNQDSYYYEAFSGNTTITDNQLAASPSLVGAEAVIRKYRWVIDRSAITAHNGSTITYGFTGLTFNGTSPSLYTPSGVGYGWFVQNALGTLDLPGEFYFNYNTDVMNVYSSNAISGHTVRAAAMDYLLNLNGKSYVTVENLGFEGANMSAIYGVNGSNVQIKSNTIRKSGAAGIQLSSISSLLIDNNDVDWSLSTGIQARCNGLSGVTITNNLVNHTFQYAGMGDYSNDAGATRGITASANNLLVQYNRVLNSGYSAIAFQGSNVNVKNNVVQNYAQVMDDMGGIYTFTGNQDAYGPPQGGYTNRSVESNIILCDTCGAPALSRDPETLYASGVYTDGKSNNINIKYNFIANTPRGGVTSNNPTGVYIRGNTFYNDSQAIRHATYKKGLVGDYHIDSNIFVQKRSGQIIFNYLTDTLRYANMGAEVNAVVDQDRNYLYLLNSNPYKFEAPVQYTPFSLSAWRAFTGKEMNSTVLKNYPTYTVTPGAVTNKYTNPSFTTNAAGVTTISATGAWDNTNQINGGTLRITFTSTAPNSYSSTYAPVGAVSGNYLFRFKTKGSSSNGFLRAFMATTGSPTIPITTKQTASFSTGIKQHEFLLNATASSATVNIEFDRSLGTVYIDDVEFYAVTASNNDLTDSVRVEWAEEDTNFVSLAYKYKDVYGKVYNGGTDTILPYQSRVYFFEGAVDAPSNTPPVVNAGATQQIKLPANQVTLTATATDADGTIVSRQWSKLTGGSVTIFSSTTNSTLVQLSTAGTYVFQFSATDNFGAITTDTVSVVVLPANIAPVANAGTDQTIQLPVSFTALNGSGIDTDGSIAGYAWTKVSGPAASIVSPTSASTTVASMTAGTYVFQLTVTDNEGGTGTDQVTVLVKNANLPPVSNAGVNKTITLPVNTVQLNGSGSDPDGTVIDYFWQKVSGGAATLADPNSATLSLSDLEEGTYTFSLTVTDNQGLTATDEAVVTVNAAPPPPNVLPTANAGSNTTITLPTNSTTLNGTGSTDSDGTIISYSWSKISGPATYTLSNATSATANLSNLVQGTYVFQLTVTDNRGGTGVASVTITVNQAPNVAPVANAGSNQTITLPTNSVTLSGAGSTDSDGSIVTYAWAKVAGPATGTINNPGSVTTNFSGLVAGTYTVQLTVTDNRGGTNSATVQVTVNPAVVPPNLPPVANAGSNQSITLPTNSVSVSGSASTDPDGTIASYQWAKTSGPATYTIVSPTSVSTSITGLVQGTYVFALTVTDNQGATNTAAVQITVTAPPNTAPTANAGSDATITMPTSSVPLSGSGADADGTIASYQWVKLSGPTAIITNGNSANATASALTKGTYIFQLTVTDNQGATGIDTKQVIVNEAPPNQPPVVSAGPDRIIRLPINFTFLSGSSSDPDGSIVSRQWTKISGPSQYVMGTSTGNSLSLFFLVQGTYVFSFRATDNSGASTTDYVTVYVQKNRITSFQTVYKPVNHE